MGFFSSLFSSEERVIQQYAREILHAMMDVSYKISTAKSSVARGVSIKSYQSWIGPQLDAAMEKLHALEIMVKTSDYCKSNKVYVEDVTRKQVSVDTFCKNVSMQLNQFKAWLNNPSEGQKKLKVVDVYSEYEAEIENGIKDFVRLNPFGRGCLDYSNFNSQCYMSLLNRVSKAIVAKYGGQMFDYCEINNAEYKVYSVLNSLSQNKLSKYI